MDRLNVAILVGLFALTGALQAAPLTATKSSTPESDDGDYLLTIGTQGYSLGVYTDDDTVYEISSPMGGIFEREPRNNLALGFRQRKFHSKTFYTILGFSYEHDPYDPAREPLEPEKSVVYAVLGLGNQWQWHFLDVGIDWLNASIPALERTGTIPDVEPAYIDAKKFDDDNKVQLRFLQIFVGFKF